MADEKVRPPYAPFFGAGTAAVVYSMFLLVGGSTVAGLIVLVMGLLLLSIGVVARGRR